VTEGLSIRVGRDGPARSHRRLRRGLPAHRPYEQAMCQAQNCGMPHRGFLVEHWPSRQPTRVPNVPAAGGLSIFVRGGRSTRHEAVKAHSVGWPRVKVVEPAALMAVARPAVTKQAEDKRSRGVKAASTSVGPHSFQYTRRRNFVRRTLAASSCGARRLNLRPPAYKLRLDR